MSKSPGNIAQDGATKYKEKGNAASAKGDWKDAKKNYTKAIEATSDPMMRSVLFSNRSLANLRLSKYDDALQDAESAASLRPDWAKAYFRKGEALAHLRRWEDAKAAFSLSLQKEDNAAVKKRVYDMQLELENDMMGLYMRQLLPGRDICVRSTLNPLQALVYEFARGMQNFIYLIGCARTREAVLVDCCWDFQGALKAAEADGYRIIGGIVTHYHFDHTGGSPPPPYNKYPVQVDGAKTVARKIKDAKIYVGSGDYKTLLEVTGVPAANLVATSDGQEIRVGDTRIRFLHTPGHTPGSQCILVNNNRLLSGDTVFLGSCGRLDFPDSDRQAMFESMQKLRALDDSIPVFPGHNYGGNVTTIGHEKVHGALAPRTFQDWDRFYGTH